MEGREIKRNNGKENLIIKAYMEKERIMYYRRKKETERKHVRKNKRMKLSQNPNVLMLL